MYSKSSILDNYWIDFLDWCSESRNFAGMGSQYETINVPTTDGVPVRTPLVTERNFWAWFLEYKYTAHKIKIAEKEKAIADMFVPFYTKILRKFKK